MTAETITQLSVHVGLGVLGLSFLLTVWRVIRGPTLPDRVIALDMLVGIVMGFIALIAIRTGFTLYIDIAISLGLVGFLATVAFARFILSRRRREGEDGTLPVMSTDSPQPAVPAQKTKPARKRAPRVTAEVQEALKAAEPAGSAKSGSAKSAAGKARKPAGKPADKPASKPARKTARKPASKETS